ncbi:alpha/beta fold hydrolase [Williamsia deligens]|uniref:Alpha/beta hydrolase n=1 Tax=Williamsia deligens TaxID=321325 RepID=A0ABW3G7V0_9NOCA|nr:alpha/beta hydrolase [Williamsia deligens]MCP2193038.1 hypothetical protein [Williamsia deligens]
MRTADATSGLGAGRYIESAAAPESTVTTVHQLTTADGATVSGVLRTVPGAQTVVALMHPRQDLTHHVLVPELLKRGFAVWTQGTRSVNNDVDLIHEQALLDVAAGQVFLRTRSFGSVVTVGHSGGGALFAFYHQQSGMSPSNRLADTPAGRPIDLASADMPTPDGAIFMAPHPGQGVLLERLIDPSVIDEADPLSVDPAFDAFNPDNGFAEPPTPAEYSDEFVGRYRAAQRRRIERIDAVAAERVATANAARSRHRASGDPADRRDAIAPRLLTVYRTDADLRFTDLRLSPNKRPYGSLFGRRPDLTDYGLVGFARTLTPEAWMSTWSATTSRAGLVRCAPGVAAPTLFIELTGDQACFPEDAEEAVAALGSPDVTHLSVDGTHFGGPLHPGGPTGASLAAAHIGGWLDDRF